MKRCVKCGEEKGESEFYSVTRSRGYVEVQARCKVCVCAAQRAGLDKRRATYPPRKTGVCKQCGCAVTNIKRYCPTCVKQRKNAARRKGTGIPYTEAQRTLCRRASRIKHYYKKTYGRAVPVKLAEVLTLSHQINIHLGVVKDAKQYLNTAQRTV